MGLLDFLKPKKQRKLEAALRDADVFLAQDARADHPRAPAPTGNSYQQPADVEQWTAMLAQVKKYSETVICDSYVGKYERESRRFHKWRFENHVTQEEQERSLDDCVQAFAQAPSDFVQSTAWPVACDVASTYIMLLASDMTTNFEIDQNSTKPYERVNNALQLQRKAKRVNAFYSAIAKAAKQTPFERGFLSETLSCTQRADDVFEARRADAPQAVSFLSNDLANEWVRLTKAISDYDRQQMTTIIRGEIERIERICSAYQIQVPTKLAEYKRAIQPQ